MTFEYHPDYEYFHRAWDCDFWDRYLYRARRDGMARGYWRNGIWITF